MRWPRKGPALVAHYEATEGANWRRNDNWLTDEPISEWFGIFTYESGHVSDLILENNRLRGSVPELARSHPTEEPATRPQPLDRSNPRAGRFH